MLLATDLQLLYTILTVFEFRFLWYINHINILNINGHVCLNII